MSIYMFRVDKAFSVYLAILCMSILTISVSKGDETSTSSLEYTAKDFLDNVPVKNHFIMFYAPWCPHCKKLLPVWGELAEDYNVPHSENIIASVNCMDETALCSDYDITSYPTLKFFKVGDSSGVKFRGTRDIPSLKTFINEQLGVDPEESPHKPAVPKPINGLVELTEENFDSHIANGKHFIKFYAPWCGYCQRLAPTWSSLAQSFEYDDALTIGKVDCTVHKKICTDFDIKGYPTLLWIEDGKKVEKYQGERTEEDLKEFIVKMLGPEHTGYKDGEKSDLEDELGNPVGMFSDDNFDHGISQGLIFVKFFAPWCGHCKRLAPTWEELGRKFISKPNVKIMKVDCTLDISKNLCNKQEVDGFPTLFLYKDGEKISEYNGSRNLDDLYEFVLKHLPHDEL